MATVPKYEVVINDPVLDAGKPQPFVFRCYAFFAVGVGRDNRLQCYKSNGFSSCYEIVEAIDTQTCGSDPVMISIDSDYYRYSSVSAGTTAGILICVVLGVVCVWVAEFHAWARYVRFEMMFFALGGVIAAVEFDLTHHMAKHAAYADNNNVDQRFVYLLGVVTIVFLPFVLAIMAHFSRRPAK
jgi:hypothetical protein